MTVKRNLVLLAGGDSDPNLRILEEALSEARVPCIGVAAGASQHPKVTWDLRRDTLTLDGKRAKPTAVFIRHDVFTHFADARPESAGRAYAWFLSIQAWAMSHPDVRLFNRRHPAGITKPHLLLAAREAGLAIPRTLVTNDLARLDGAADRAKLVIKPVTGGDICRPLEPVLASEARHDGAAASPAIVQQLLVPPELRVYRIGRRFFSFHIVADALDYRTARDARVVPVENDPALIPRLRRLMNALRMDFGAADFKASSKSGEQMFLEVNSAPMFAVFDAAGGGKLARAIVEWLTT